MTLLLNALGVTISTILLLLGVALWMGWVDGPSTTLARVGWFLGLTIVVFGYIVVDVVVR